MATGRIDRSDDTAAVLKIVATVADSEDAVTKQWQGVYLADGTSPASHKAAVNTDNALQVSIIENGHTAEVSTINGTDSLWVGLAHSVLEDDASDANPLGLPAMGRRRDTLATETSTDGDSTALNCTGKGELYVKHVDAIPITDNAGSLTVDGSVTVTQATGTNLHTVVDSGTITTITNVVHVDDNAGSITVDNGGTFAVQATIASGATSIAKAEDVASADADVGVPAMAVRKATPANTSGTDGDYEMLQISAGRLWASATIDAALPAGTNAIGKLAANSGVTIGAIEIAAAQTLATVSTITNVVHVDDNAGSLTVDGNVGVLPLTSGGCSIAHVVSAASTNATNVKASAGQVYGWTLTNNVGYPVYVKLHNTAGTPTAGAGVVRAIGCQAGTSVTYHLPTGIAFGTGIAYTIVKDITDAGATAVAASDCVFDMEYK